MGTYAGETLTHSGLVITIRENRKSNKTFSLSGNVVPEIERIEVIDPKIDTFIVNILYIPV